MSDGLLPPGMQAYLLGTSISLADMSVFAPLEEGAAEGALMLMRLDYGEFPDSSSLTELSAALSDAGISPWLGWGYIVFASDAEPSIYLCWTKEFAWLPIIIGAIAGIALPPLLGAGLWLIIPEPIQEMIESVIYLVMIGLVMFGMAKLMPASTPRKKKRPEIEEEPE